MESWYKMLALGGSGSGGVSSWNDLTDKPFDIVELLPDTQFVYVDSMGLFMAQTDFQFVAGKTYTINWNGTEYTTTAKTYFYGGNVLIAVGNEAFVGGETNGMPFVIGITLFDSTAKGVVMAIPLDGSTAVTVGIKGEEVTQTDALMLDARVSVMNSSGNISVIYATQEQVLNAFTAGKTISALAPIFNSDKGTAEVIGMAKLNVSAANNTDTGIVISMQREFPTEKSYQFKYNGDGTFVPYSG